ncbi:hypothetical protein A2U01_0017996, partial [Trifolium medium]|nr:hypothetical protein [Trifolium medium]
KVLKKAYPELVEEERTQKINVSFLTRMGLKNKVVKPINPLQAKYEDHFFCDGFPVISEADDEEVILNFLEYFNKETGINVPRSMVPPAPNVDLYKPKKRKRTVKMSEEEAQKEVAQKKEAQKEEVKKEAKKKKGEKKRKAEGIKIDEEISKKRHDKKSSKSDSGTESDERTLAQKMKQRTSKETFKKHLKNFSKGKSSENIIDDSFKAQNIPGLDIPLTTILPEPQTINVSSSSSPDTAELDKEADMLKEGIAKYGETPNPEVVAQHLFEVKQTPNLDFLEKHLSPDPMNTQTFTHDQPEQTQPDQTQQETNQEHHEPSSSSPNQNKDESNAEPQQNIPEPPI